MITPDASARRGAADPPVWQPEHDPDAAEEVATSEIAPAPVSRTRAGVPARRGSAPGRRASSTTSLFVVAALVAFGGVGFAVGHLTGSGQTGTQSGNFTAFRASASGAPAAGARAASGGALTVTGTVVSVSADSITLQLASGATETIATGSSTTYHNQTAGSSSDLAAGQTVQVQTSGGSSAAPNASASPDTQTTRTATDVTITSN
jgi:hypothetical protein